MTPISPSESVPAPEAPLFKKNEAINELSMDNTAEPVKYETPTYVLENKVEGGKDKNEGFYISKKMMKIGTAAVLAIGLATGGIFWGVSSANKGNNAGETGLGGGEPTEDSSSMETSGTEATTVDSESLVVTVAPSETIDQTNTSETVASNPEIFSNIEYLPQDKSLAEMKAINNIEDWAKLSPVDRAAYFVLTNEIGNKGNLAGDINGYTASNSFSESMSLFALGDKRSELQTAFDKGGLEAMKLISAAHYYTMTLSGGIEPTFESDANTLSNQVGGNLNNNMVFVKSGTPRQTGKDTLTGKPITFTNVTYVTESMDGNTTIKPETTVQLIEVPVHLETGNDVIVFMSGYETGGEASPDTNYPY